jgi:DNA-binding transcriptional ArsR family regulator
VLATLSNPHRLRVLAALSGGRVYVSRLARELSMSRPLLQMHLKKLESAGLVRSKLELSDDGKAMNFYELVPFSILLDAASVTKAARSLTTPSDAEPRPSRKH